MDFTEKLLGTDDSTDAQRTGNEFETRSGSTDRATSGGERTEGSNQRQTTPSDERATAAPTDGNTFTFRNEATNGARRSTDHSKSTQSGVAPQTADGTDGSSDTSPSPTREANVGSENSPDERQPKAAGSTSDSSVDTPTSEYARTDTNNRTSPRNDEEADIGVTEPGARTERNPTTERGHTSPPNAATGSQVDGSAGGGGSVASRNPTEGVSKHGGSDPQQGESPSGRGGAEPAATVNSPSRATARRTVHIEKGHEITITNESTVHITDAHEVSIDGRREPQQRDHQPPEMGHRDRRHAHKGRRYRDSSGCESS